jgi:hypothetical protein
VAEEAPLGQAARPPELPEPPEAAGVAHGARPAGVDASVQLARAVGTSVLAAVTLMSGVAGSAADQGTEEAASAEAAVVAEGGRRGQRSREAAAIGSARAAHSAAERTGGTAAAAAG